MFNVDWKRFSLFSLVVILLAMLAPSVLADEPEYLEDGWIAYNDESSAVTFSYPSSWQLDNGSNEVMLYTDNQNYIRVESLPNPNLYTPQAWVENEMIGFHHVLVTEMDFGTIAGSPALILGQPRTCETIPFLKAIITHDISTYVITYYGLDEESYGEEFSQFLSHVSLDNNDAYNMNELVFPLPPTDFYCEKQTTEKTMQTTSQALICPGADMAFPSLGKVATPWGCEDPTGNGGVCPSYPNVYQHPHAGLDIFGTNGVTPVFATYAGIVTYGRGKERMMIHFDSPYQDYSVYMTHMADSSCQTSYRDVPDGTHVSRGQVVGRQGSCGADSTHLHVSYVLNSRYGVGVETWPTESPKPFLQGKHLEMHDGYNGYGYAVDSSICLYDEPPQPACNEGSIFCDVPITHPFYNSIEALAQAGIIGGYSDGTYRPSNILTRDQLAAFAKNGAEIPTNTSCGDFPDVTPANGFYEYITSIKCAGIVGGYSDGMYHPEREVDRTVMAVVTQRAFDINIDTSCGAFPDVDITHPGYEYITTLKCKGIIGGYSDGNYKPSEMVDRGMTAKFIARAACLEVDNHNAAYCSGNEPAPEISVQFTAPAANAVIGPSSQVIQTDVQGNDIDHVTFYAVYDGELHYLGDDTAAPYEMGWETPAVIDQKVKLVVHAVTSAGNFAEDYRMINFVGFSDGVKRTLPIENRYYLNQRSLYPSGDIKCASASAAMVLAMNGTIGGDYESMKNTANSIWSEIGVPDIGKVSNAINKRGYNTEVLNGDLNSKWDRLKSEINAGHPVIIDSYHGMTSDGHFIVAVGYEDNDDPAQRNIYVYDPFGKHSSCYPASQCPTSGDRWDKLNTYSADSSNGRWVVYPWNKLQDYMALGVIVVRPNTQRVIAKTTGLDFEPEFISTEPSGVEGEPYGNHASSLTFIAESSQAQSFQFSGELGDFSLETMPITGTANISNSYVSQEHQFPHVSPETITIYANSTTGWVLNKVTCDNGTQFVSSSNNDLSSIDISLNLGDDVTCIFTYDLGDNNSGDGTWATDWTATFAGGDQSLCQHEPGWINTTLTVKPIPAGSKGYLQTDWYVVGNNPSTCPADDANCMDSHYQSQLIEGETTIQLRAWWPGIYAEDGVVENHFSANLLDENHNVIHDGIGQDFYWYPWVCSAPDPSPGSIKIVKESNPHTGQSFDFASDLGAFSLYQGMAKSFSDLTAGTYNVSESNRTLLAADNWSLLSVTCREQHGYHVPPQTDLTNFSAMINMKSGQDLTCTFLNEKVNLESDIHVIYLTLILR